MRLFILLAAFCFFSTCLHAQNPNNDHCWGGTPQWNDEFNGPTLDKTKWQTQIWWGLPSDTLIPYPGDTNNYTFNNGAISLVGKREDYEGYYKIWYEDPDTKQIIEDAVWQTYKYTNAILTTGRWPKTEHIEFIHGYMEARLLFQDNIDTALFGYINSAFWLYEGDNLARNVMWSEIDICEVLYWNAWHNTYTSNYHHETFLNSSDITKGYCEPDHFIFHKIENGQDGGRMVLDPNTGELKCDIEFAESHPLIEDRYWSTNLSSGWHVLGLEWLPGQLKFYLDGKLVMRLEEEYLYKYRNSNNDTVGFAPAGEATMPLPLILGVGFGGDKGDPNAPNQSNQVTLGVDYVRWYKLQKSCNQDYHKINFDFATQYTPSEHKVYKTAIFGQMGCPNCSAIVSNGTRATVRASQYIRFEDGFEVTAEGEFYAHDVDCNAIQ